jgi:TonB-linked SusC/RagA family outer membrane protein
VILINTKKGSSGQSFIEVDAKFGQNFSALPRYPTIKSPEEYMEIGWNSVYNRGVALDNADPEDYANTNLFSGAGVDPFYNMWDVPGNELIDPATGKIRSGVNRLYDPENWEDYAFQASSRLEGNVRLGGGTDKTNYFMSVGYLDDVGYSINSDFERISTRLNVNHKVKEWLTGGFNIGYSSSETNNGGQSEDSGSIFWFVDNIPAIYPLFLRDENGEKIPDPYYGGFQYDYGESRGFGGLTNAISDANNTIQNRKSHDLNGNANLAVDFYEDLRFESRFGWQYYNSSYDELNSPFYGPSASTNGSIYKTKTEIFTYNFTNLLRYNKSFGENEIEVLAAHESNSWRRSFLTGFKQQLVDPFSTEFNNAVVTNPSTSYTRDYALESYFTQVNYNYEQKYFVTASLRRDGSSRFVKDKWGTFWSVGAAWVLSEEGFMSTQSVFDFLKVKASYGLTGDQAGVGYYPGYDLFEISNLDGSPSLTFDTKGNPDLTWETSKMFQTGVEFRMGRWLDANIDYYLKNTDDLIFDRRVGPSIGYALVTVNDGNLRNAGLEFDITGHIVKTRDFYLDLSVNGEFLQNELTRMPIDPATNEQKVLDISGRYGRAVGKSIYDYYLREWAGVDPETGQAQWNLYFDDKNGDGEVSEGEAIRSLHEYLDENPDSEATIKQTTTTSYQEATQKFVDKSAIPTVRGAINLAVGFKGFDFSILLRYGIGGYSYDAAYADLMSNDQVGGNNWHTDIRDRWQQEGDVTDVPRLSNDLDQNYRSASTRFLLKSDYLNLTNVQLGYTFPTSLVEKIGIKSLRLFVAGDNLFLMANRDGFNPTTNVDTGSARYTYDPLSTVTGGLNIKF